MQPLTGVRVLDLSRLIPGPFATLVLADLGATVDKVEDPGAGDYLRHFPPAVASGDSAAFAALNRGKRSLVLDLKKPEARDALLTMLGSYDVLLEQFRPAVMDRLGLGHEEMRQRHPRLIVCALTGYGQTGALAQRAGHDLNYLARAGLLGFQGPAEGPPAVPAHQLADVSGALWCVVAIQAALAERERTGEGTIIDVAMADGVLGFASASVAAALAGHPAARGEELLTGGIAPYNTYLSRDGAPVTLAALEPKFWGAFCAGAGLEPDPAALVPGPHQRALRERVAEVFRSKTRAEWAAFAERHDCCVEVVLAPEELAHDRRLRERGVVFDVETPSGTVPQLRTPVTPRDLTPRPAPRAGEHSSAILRDGGLSEEAIDALFAARAAVQA